MTTDNLRKLIAERDGWRDLHEAGSLPYTLEIERLQAKCAAMLDVIDAAKAMRESRFEWDVPVAAFDAALDALEGDK